MTKKTASDAGITIIRTIRSSNFTSGTADGDTGEDVEDEEEGSEEDEEESGLKTLQKQLRDMCCSDLLHEDN